MSLEIAGWQITAVSDGTFALDGGAMHGIIPRPLWEETSPADEKNRIRLALRCLLLRGHDRVVLVDTGMGSKWSARHRDVFGIDQTKDDLVRSLAAKGVSPGDVTDVVLTHLHFDHTGGTTRTDPDGALLLTFPEAVHHVSRANWHWAWDPTERDRGSYLRENFEPLSGSDFLRLVDEGETVLPGITPRFSDGHTVGLMQPMIADGSSALVYCADLIPTCAHLHLPYVMGYDLHPVISVVEKRRLLEDAARDGYVLVFEHDPQIGAARITLDGSGRAIVSERVDL